MANRLGYSFTDYEKVKDMKFEYAGLPLSVLAFHRDRHLANCGPQQPTSFRLNTYELPLVFDTPELITSLALYSESRQPQLDPIEAQKPIISTAYKKSKHIYDEVSSTLFLQIFAAADYYTMNQTLMEHVPPVFVDIILDPYILNIFPRSLIPTTAYIIILSIGSWFLSKHIGKWLKDAARDEEQKGKKAK
jgi:hypothetical protein